MAPATSGIRLVDTSSSHELCEHTLTIAQQVLKPNGYLVMKIFQGVGVQPLLREVQQSFLQTRTLKPTSTRGESMETFIIAHRKKFEDKKNTSSQPASQPSTTRPEEAKLAQPAITPMPTPTRTGSSRR
jgi:hypothetical protein